MTFQISNKTLEKYKNKNFEELFGECEIVENEFGEFLKIINPFSIEDFQIQSITKEELGIFERILRSEFQLIPGIGEKKSLEFNKRSMSDMSDLLGLYAKYSCQISEILGTISSKDIHKLRMLKKTHDEDYLFCVNDQDMLFLDIETTGRATSEVFLIGIGYYCSETSRFRTELLFAREISEEVAVLSYFLKQLPRYKMFVTYNGRSFDIPFLQNRVSVLFEPDDLEDTFKQIVRSDPIQNTIGAYGFAKQLFDQFIHFDLYYAFRRDFKNFFPNYRLTTVEQFLLDFKRVENLPSSEVPLAYKLYIEDTRSYMGAIYKILEHNFFDVVNLERLLSKWMHSQIENYYVKNYQTQSQTRNYEGILTKLTRSKSRLRSYNLDPFLE
ncbi:MAG: ribonuclease H-like domain-containing protein [Candidatus Lokiarchaeota archaeon]|nr:ribonuclease H-like domain-containing protein [Candidatus Lokiarchaeota archaeon]